MQGLNLMSTNTLLNLQNQIKKEFSRRYYAKENFYLHDKLDGYTYIIHYPNEKHKRYSCYGSKAYEIFQNDSLAIKITRTDNEHLFPKEEELLNREKVLVKKGEQYLSKEAKAVYNAEYDKKNTKQVKVKLNINTDKDILEYLANVENKNALIKELLRKHIRKDK